MSRLLAAAVALLLLGNAIAVATVDDSADGGDGRAASTTTTPPSSTSSSGPSAAPTTSTTTASELDATVAQLQRFVAERRGLQFLGPLKVTLLGEAAFRAKILELAKDDDDELEETARELVALGLLERGTDLRKARDELLGGAVIGAYDAKTKQFYVKGQRITPFVRTTLVHEITHALQDQHFDIEHPEYDDREDEIGIAFSAVAEGDASRIEEAYRNTLSDREREAEVREQREASDDVDYRTVPPVLLKFLVFPYADGPGLVSALMRAGGQARVDAAFRNPPTTSEQVLHPERFLAGEGPKPVADPPADGAVVDKGVVGEFLLKVMLETALSDSVARAAAAGWGGDRYVAWRDGEKTCVRIAWKMDTAEDMNELRDAITRWAARQSEASVTGGDPLVATSCG